MQKIIEISSSQRQQILDLTEKIKQIIKESKVKIGICQIYTPHATAAIAINENWDPNIGLDLLNVLNELIPQGKWLHDRVDNNGAAHLKSAIIGPSETIPIIDEKLQLGRWQNIVLCDFDGPKKRKIIITLLPLKQNAQL